MPPPDPDPIDATRPHIPFQPRASYPARPGNLVRPWVDGEPAFRRICQAVEAARHSVWLTVTFLHETFRMPDGRGSLFDVLARAADRGLDVRALIWRCDPASLFTRYAVFSGTPAQREMLQDAVNRFWWPSLMMFGPSDKDSPNSAELLKWRVKRKTNDELRQRFVNLTVPQAQAIGVTLPDPDLRYNTETKTWDFGPIDWAEFKQVITGNGPCNRERLEARNLAHEEGRWVREAALAYAAKQRRSTEAA